MQVLRDYQRDLVNRVLASTQRRSLVVLPTGAGKTTVAAGIAAQWQGDVLFVADRQELCDQAFERLGPGTGLLIGPHRIEAAPGCPTVVGVHTVSRREVRIPATLVFLDEAHLAANATFKKVAAWYPEARIVGLTATPYRLSGDPLTDVFDEAIPGPDVRWLIDNGYLADVVTYAQPGDLARAARVRAGEFAAEDLDALMTPKVLRGAIDLWRNIAGDMKTIAFACNKRHAADIAALTGFDVVLDDTPREVRRTARERLASGAVRGLVSVGVLGLGWDAPEAECCLGLRPTMSRNIAKQQVGRIMRLAPGKTKALYLDCAGNVGRHGLPTTPDVIDLASGVPAIPKGAVLLTVVNCHNCLRAYDAALERCPGCGAPPPVRKRIVRTVAGVLEEVHGIEESGAQLFARTATNEARRSWVQKRLAMGWKVPRIFAVYQSMWHERMPPQYLRK